MKKKKKKTTSITPIVSIAIATMLLFSGIAYGILSGRFKSTQITNISVGKLNLIFDESTSTINMNNSLPQFDNDAIENNITYSFSLTNNESVAMAYSIALENICSTDSGEVDICVPDTYIKVGLSIDGEDYQIISLAESNILINETIATGVTKLFDMKIWLDINTPNTYNSSNQDVFYKGKMELQANQLLGTIVTNITTSLGSSQIDIGNQTEATAEITPSNATITAVTWTSNNTSVATVNANGIITGISQGTARICATAKDGSGVEGCSIVTVKQAS